MEAIYSFDPKRFRLGTLCLHGHAWPGTTQSLRRIHATASGCAGCTGRKDSSWLLSFIDYEAMGWPTNQTLGKLCKKEHKWEGQNASLRRWGKCVECEKLRKIEQSQRKQRKSGRRWHPELRGLSPTERRKLYKRKLVQELRAQGLTSKGTVPTRADAGVARGERNEAMALERAFERALGTTRRSPSVAQLVMNQQRQYWKENPEARNQYERQWRKYIYAWKYKCNPSFRRYECQRNSARKARYRGNHTVKLCSGVVDARFADFDNQCAFCGSSNQLIVEHFIPRSKGGPHAIGNILPACYSCNMSKFNHDPEEWYRSRSYFSETRWRKILRALGKAKTEVHQLPLL